MRHPVLSEREGLSKVASKPVVLSVLLSMFALGLGTGAAPAIAATTNAGPIIIPMAHMDVSEPLVSERPGDDRHHNDAKPHRPVPEGRRVGQSSDSVSPVSIAPRIPSTAANFDGVGNGFSGPQGTFTVNSAPPDTNGAVGPQDYVQTVNTDFAIFNKDATRGTVGSVRYGPVQINTLWSGFGGLCQTDNDGDPIVVYDSIANRWLISQFAVTNPNPNFYQCVAVS